MSSPGHDTLAVETLTALVENRPGVLNRLTTLLRRRNFDVRSLSMGRSEDVARHRVTITVGGGEAAARKVAEHLSKLVEVVHVEPVLDQPAVRRDLVLIKISPEAAELPAVNALCSVFRARVVDVSPDSAIVEITGEPTKIERFVDLLTPFRLVELARSECVAMFRGAPLHLTANSARKVSTQ